MQKINIKELKKNDYNKIGGDIERLVRQENHLLDSPYTDTISISFIGILLKENEYNIQDFTIDIEDETLKYHLQMILKRYRSLIEKIISKYNSEELISVVLFYSEQSSISKVHKLPEDVFKLIYKLLDIKQSETVVDLKSGYGDFLINSYLLNDGGKHIGFDSNIISNTIAKMKFYLLDMFGNIEQRDIVNIEENLKFDKIFSFPPLGVRVRSNLKNIEEIYPETVKRVLNIEWIFALKASKLLKNNGKAIILMTKNSLNNSIDGEVRKYFIENGLIESIITLPINLFYETTISLSIVVLSKHNKKIRLVDASNDFTNNRFKNILEEENIKNILNKLEKNSEESIEVGIEEFKKYRYQLEPSRFLNVLISDNAIKLEELIESINRGSNLTKNQLEEITVENRTDTRFMNLKDIDEGKILSTMSYIDKELAEDKNIFKYPLKKGDLILSRTGSPIKIAIVEDLKGEEIYYTGNLYSIRFDKNKVNPYYVKAFFESLEGQKILNSISSGSSIPVISRRDLEELKIPYIDLEKQEEFVEDYINRNNEINSRKIEIEEMEEQLRESIDTFFQEVIE